MAIFNRSKEVAPEPEVAPSPPTTETYDNLLGNAFAGIIAGDPEPEGQPPSEEELEEEEEEVEEPEPDEEDEDEEDASTGEEAPQATAPSHSTTQWAAVLREQPARINEVPARDRGRVIEQLIRNEYDSYVIALQEVNRQAEERVKLRLDAESEFHQLEQMRNDDRDSFIEWEDANPDKAEAFRQYRMGKVQQKDNSTEVYQRLAMTIMAPLSQDQKMDFYNRRAEFPANDAGMAKLQAEVVKLLSVPTPEVTKAVKRQESSNGREKLPKIDNSKGSPVGAREKDPVASNNDYTSLLSMGMRDAIQSNPGRQAVKR